MRAFFGGHEYAKRTTQMTDLVSQSSSNIKNYTGGEIRESIENLKEI